MKSELPHGGRIQVGRFIAFNMKKANGRTWRWYVKVTNVTADSFTGIKVGRDGAPKEQSLKDGNVALHTCAATFNDVSSVEVWRMNLKYAEIEYDPTGSGQTVNQ